MDCSEEWNPPTDYAVELAAGAECVHIDLSELGLALEQDTECPVTPELGAARDAPSRVCPGAPPRKGKRICLDDACGSPASERQERKRQRVAGARAEAAALRARRVEEMMRALRDSSSSSDEEIITYFAFEPALRASEILDWMGHRNTKPLSFRF